MELEKILELIDDPNTLISDIRSSCEPLFDSTLYKEYTPATHRVIWDKRHRPDRTLYEPKTDENGMQGKNPDGSPKTTKVSLPVIRISIPFEKKVIATKSAFTCGKITLKAQFDKGSVEEKLFEAVKKVWKKNKLDFKTKALLRHRMSESECAELWFGQKDGQLRMNILAPSLGHTLRPIWDSILDLVGFAVEYKLKVDGKDVDYVDVYTNEKLYKFNNLSGVYLLDEQIDITYGKIPIIYWFQAKPECVDIIGARERYENLISDLGEQNKRTGFPITFATGKVQGVPAGEPGKFLQGEIGSDVKFITNNNAPESIKLEMETLKAEMHSAVSTPDLSLDAMKGLGDISGEALKRLLIDLYLAAKNEQDGDTGECIQRRINFLMSACISMDQSLSAAADMDITAEFEIFTLDEVLDRVAIAQKANGGLAVVSQKTAFNIAGMTENPDDDFEEYKKEIEAAKPVTVPPAVS